MSTRRSKLTLELDNGTAWPDPCVDPRELEEPTRTYYINQVLSAYNHLTTHPVGTEATIRTLRELRRAAEKHRPLVDE